MFRSGRADEFNYIAYPHFKMRCNFHQKYLKTRCQ